MLEQYFGNVCALGEDADRRSEYLLDEGFLRFEALAGVARVFIDRGLLEEARRILMSTLREARRSETDSPALARILSTLGEWALRTGALSEAEVYFNETLSISRRTDNSFFAISAAFGLGRCAEAARHLDQALGFYDPALSAVDQGLSGIASDVHRAESKESRGAVPGLGPPLPGIVERQGGKRIRA